MPVKEMWACLGQQFLGQIDAHLPAVGYGAAAAACDHFGAIGAQHLAAQVQCVTVERGQPGDRRFARPVKRQQEGAFGDQALACGRVMDRGKQGLGVHVTCAAFDADGPLGDRGQHVGVVDRGGGDVFHAQSVQARHGKEGAFGHTVSQLAQTGLNVAAEFDDLQIWAFVQQLRPAAQA